MNSIGMSFTLKSGSLKTPDLCLGARISKFYISSSDDGDKHVWAMSSDDYVKTVLENVQTELVHVGLSLQGKSDPPIQSEYRPELDSSSELPTPLQITFYQGLISQQR